MKNSFDRLIDGLAQDYGIPSFPDKNHDDEIYCFAFDSGISIKIYQDQSRWVYFLAELGQVVEVNDEALRDMLYLNSFSFRKPFLTLGLNMNNGGELHARTPLVEVNNIEMREIFETILNAATEIKKKYNFK